MLPYERHRLILDILQKERFVKISELLRLTHSSLTTLRRDINQLVEDGRIRKSRGGVLLSTAEPADDGRGLHDRRNSLHQEEKERIGLAAQPFIEDRDILFLLNGTTTISVARNIDAQKRITVITNGIDIVAALRDKSNIEVILLGGIIDYAHNVVTGPMVLKELDDLHATKLISGAGGITEEKGITIYPYLVSAYYSRIVEMVREVIVVADHTKIGRNALVQVAPISRIHTLITGRQAPPEYLELFRRHRVRLVLA